MNIVIATIFILWGIRIFRNLLSYIQLWYVKEYRFDRMWIHFFTDQGKKLLFLPFKLPPKSPKTISLFILTSVSIIVFYLISPYSWLITLLVLDLFSFPTISLWVAVLKIPTILYHHWKITKAIELLKTQQFKHVIGITGSYGKTSTKEFLEIILSSKYKVLKTETSKNSPIAIAELILHKLKPEHEIFIVEMAAYKKGEIAHMTQMVKPDIGIITAINAQHQDLFGSLEHKMKAKYELIAGLTGQKIAIFNADNVYTKEMSTTAQKDRCKVFFYTKKQKEASPHILSASKITFFPEKIMFTAKMDKEQVHVEAPVLGEHQVENISAALLAARACGMTLAETAIAAKQLHPFTGTMKPIQGIHGARFIDDTFNNNPDAAKAAISYLSHFKGRKILVFQPMIELGEFTESAHEEVGRYAASVCDEVILTNHNFFNVFEKGFKSAKSNAKLLVLGQKEAASHIKTSIKISDVVLFKGKEAIPIVNFLKENI